MNFVTNEVSVMDFVKRTWAEISLDAIAHNFKEIQEQCKKLSQALLRDQG